MSLIKRPSGWLPIAFSSIALAVVLGYLAMFGAVRETDEGAAAHIFQILMVAQLPFIAFFALKWLFRETKQALLVLGLQLGAALAALAPVYFLNL